MGIKQSSDPHVPWLLLHLSPPALKRATVIWCERIRFLLSLSSSHLIPAVYSPSRALLLIPDPLRGVLFPGDVPFLPTESMFAPSSVSLFNRDKDRKEIITDETWHRSKYAHVLFLGMWRWKIEGAVHSAPAKSSGIRKGPIRVKPINKPCDHLIVTQNTFYSRARRAKRNDALKRTRDANGKTLAIHTQNSMEAPNTARSWLSLQVFLLLN